MNRHLLERSSKILAACCLLQFFGCNLVDSYIPGYTSWTTEATRTQNDLESQHRKRFQLEGDPESIQWLKANRLRQGMPLGDVNQVLGMKGTAVIDQQRYIAKSSLYQNSDRVYRWGPDATGNSHLLVFRNDRLVNYDPKEFQED